MRASTSPERRQRRVRLVAVVCRLGVRAVFEFIDELARRHPKIADDIDDRLLAYSRLDPVKLRATGGDQLPPPPIHRVPR